MEVSFENTFWDLKINMFYFEFISNSTIELKFYLCEAYNFNF